MADASRKILNYGDVLLRQGDLDLLAGPNWLNDQVIAFFFEYLALEAFPNQPRLLLLDGATSYLAALSGPGQADFLLQPLGFASKEQVLFAVNNNPDAEVAGGGSHWSLLALHAPARTFYHFDSAAGLNSDAARALYAAVHPLGSRLLEQRCPQQQNGWDCGMYVLALAQLLCQRYAQAGAALSLEVQGSEVDQMHVSALRRKLHQLIKDKAAQQQQQQDVAAQIQ